MSRRSMAGRNLLILVELSAAAVIVIFFGVNCYLVVLHFVRKVVATFCVFLGRFALRVRLLLLTVLHILNVINIVIHIDLRVILKSFYLNIFFIFLRQEW
jgi:hypothetical protein